jgi:hypothetical protein
VARRGALRLGAVRFGAFRFAAFAFLTWFASTAMAAALADGLIFLPPAPSYDASLPGLLRLPTAEGDTIAARWVETPGARVAHLFAHGNAEDVGHGRYVGDAYADLGASVLAIEYPGYGLSTGRASETGAYAAIDAAYTWLREEAGFAPEAIVAHGRSLGAAVAVDLASREAVGGLVIESGFVSAYRVMTRVPLLPFDQFTSLAKLPSVDAPVLVIHGGLDAVIALWHGRRLHDAVPEHRRAALWVERAGHNDLADVAGEAYWRTLADFFWAVGEGVGR